jgi:hypothetical protein
MNSYYSQRITSLRSNSIKTTPFHQSAPITLKEMAARIGYSQSRFRQLRKDKNIVCRRGLLMPIEQLRLYVAFDRIMPGFSSFKEMEMFLMDYDGIQRERK